MSPQWFINYAICWEIPECIWWRISRGFSIPRVMYIHLKDEAILAVNITWFLFAITLTLSFSSCTGTKAFPVALLFKHLKDILLILVISVIWIIHFHQEIYTYTQGIHFSNNFKVKISRGLLKIHSRISNSRLRAINSIFCCSQNKHFLHPSPTFFYYLLLRFLVLLLFLLFNIDFMG